MARLFLFVEGHHDQFNPKAATHGQDARATMGTEMNYFATPGRFEYHNNSPEPTVTGIKAYSI